MAEDLDAVEAVLLDLLEFGVGEAAGLVEDRFGHADLADVVEQCGELDRVDLFFAETELMGDAGGEGGDALRVAVRVTVLRVDGRDDRSDRIEEEALELGAELGALDRDAGLVADQRQQLQVAFGEGAGAAAVVGVEHAEHRIVGGYGGAHDGADLLADDAFAGAVAGVRRGVLAQGRDSVLQNVLHHGPAHRDFAGAAVPLAVARPHDTQRLRPVALIAEQQGGSVRRDR